MKQNMKLNLMKLNLMKLIATFAVLSSAHIVHASESRIGALGDIATLEDPIDVFSRKTLIISLRF